MTQGTSIPGSAKPAVASGLLQFGCWAGGIALLLWALLSPRFRDGEGLFDSGVCLPLSSGVALLVLGAVASGRWVRFRRSVFWFALALIGQAVHLQMIDAGTNVAYQHLRSPRAILTELPLILVGAVAFQTLAVLWGLRNVIGSSIGWIRKRLGWWSAACIGALFVLTSGTKINVPVPVFAVELFCATFIQILGVATIVLGALELPSAGSPGDKAPVGWLDSLVSGVRSGDAGARRIDRFAIVGALWVVVASYGLCVLSYERHPHIPDEVLYLMHARYFAEGELTLSAPPVPDAIQLYLMELEADRWYSPVPPGWPAVLAIGVFFGAPWFVNPVLAGLTVLGAYVLLQKLYDRRTARFAVLLVCTSPWFLFLAMSLMTHTLTLACGVGATLAIVWAREQDRAVWGWVGGVALGIIGLIRPLEGLAMASLLGLWSIGVGGRRLKVSAIVGLVLGAALTGAIVLPYNKSLTGDPLKFPIMAYVDKHFGPGKNSLGFGPDKGLGWRGVDPFEGHGAIDVAMNAHLNTHSVNTELHGWCTGSLLLISLAVFGARMNRSDRLMLAAIVVVVGLHSLYWYSGGPDFGARYWYLIFIPCIALSVRGMDWIARGANGNGSRSPLSDRRGVASVLALCAISLVTYLPWRAIDKYHHFRRMRPDIRDLAEEHSFGRSLVLIRGNGRDDYASAFVYNPIDLQADVPIYAWDRGDEIRQELLKVYTDRPVWIVEGPSITGGSFRVAAGPLRPDDLMSEGTP